MTQSRLVGPDGQPIKSMPSEPGRDMIEFAMDALDMNRSNTLIIRIAPAATQREKEDIRKQVRIYLKQRNLERMNTLMVPGDIRLESVDDVHMERCGWIRKGRRVAR